MHVFVTGASGWIGSAVVPALLARGHEVTGLARSDASAACVEAAGARVLRGDLDDLDALRRGAEAADAVVHLANKHDFANPKESDRAERAAVETLGDALAGTGKGLLLASGTAIIKPGSVATEDDAIPFSGPDAPRGGTEALALDYVAKGVRSVSLRFAPTVHGDGDHGFIAMIVANARQNGRAAYVGDGSARWSAVNRADAGELVALAVESAEPGTLVHAIGEEQIPTREIAEAIGRGLDLPVASITAEEALEQMGFIGRIFSMDIPASSAITRERFGWEPTHPGLIADLDAGYYFRG